MKVVIRVDASLQIGMGHVVRCLTLAKELRHRSANVTFICKEHEGNLCASIENEGFTVFRLSELHDRHLSVAGSSSFTCGLGQEAWQVDAEATKTALATIHCDWLIVDHYALNAEWEIMLRPYTKKIMVIDDLVNRTHDCDILLDQTLGRFDVAYQELVPPHCTILTGVKYALLRPEFSALRESSLSRRSLQPELKQILVSMGGIDQHNVTCKVLEALQCSVLSRDCHIVVVLGSQSPALDAVIEQTKVIVGKVSVKVDVKNMAQLMVESDLAIGAAGTSSWERCCLGLPTFLIVVAENQWDNAKAQVASKAALLLGQGENALAALPEAIEKCISTNLLAELSAEAGQLCDGAGVRRVLASMEGACCD